MSEQTVDAILGLRFFLFSVLATLHLKFLADVLDLVVRVMFDADELGAGVVERSDNFVEFGLHCRAISVLGVLDQEDHQERDDCRRGVHDELPRIGIVKNQAQCDDECNWLAGEGSDATGDGCEETIHG